MIQDQAHAAKRYRLHAEELRALAEETHSSFNRDALMKAASEYELIADVIEQTAARRPDRR